MEAARDGGAGGWKGGGNGRRWRMERERGMEGFFYPPPLAGGGASAKRSRGVEREAAGVLFQQSAVAVQRFAAVFRKQIQQILHAHLRAGVAADIQHRPTLMKHYRSLAAT